MRMLIGFIVFFGANIAQGAQISLGSVGLELGADQNVILKRCPVRESLGGTPPIADSDCWLIPTPERERFIVLVNSGTRHELEGTITFEQGRLAVIQRKWGESPLGRSQLALLQDFFQLLSAKAGSDWRSIDIKIVVAHQPDIKAQSLTMMVGDSGVRLILSTMTSGLNEPTLELSEIFGGLSGSPK